MSKLYGKMYNEASDMERNVYTGFSWPCLFFGPWWFISKGMIGRAFTYLLFYPAFVYPFTANSQYREYLAQIGYKIHN